MYSIKYTVGLSSSLARSVSLAFYLSNTHVYIQSLASLKNENAEVTAAKAEALDTCQDKAAHILDLNAQVSGLSADMAQVRKYIFAHVYEYM